LNDGSDSYFFFHSNRLFDYFLMITFTAEMNEALAIALAQFVKRVGFSEIRSNAVDDFEAYLIRDALVRVRIGLANAGFSPR
jgi:hypothetical protein